MRTARYALVWMKSARLMCIAVMALFAALAIAVQLAAQQENASHPRYKLIDLGTFGGPNSFFAGPFPPAQDVNNRGTAIGTADTSISDPFFPFCFTDCFVSHAFKWQNGTLTDLGALPGGSSSFAGYISASGRIAGGSQNGLIDPITGVPESRAVVWTTDGQIVDLGTFGGNESFLSAINNRGDAVGAAQNAIPDPFAFCGCGTQTRGFLWKKGVLLDVGTLGGPDAFAFFVNNRRQVAGVSFTDSTPNPSTGIPTVHPFLFENGRINDLGTLGGLGGPANFSSSTGITVEANALNSRGEVAGTSPLAGDQTHHAFLWNGSLTDLGTLGGDNSQAFWVSDSGLVVGRADFSPQSTNHHAFLWKNGVMTDLGVLGPCLDSTAVGVNSQGQAVGDTGACPGGGDGPSFFSEQGQPMVDINTLVLPGSDVEVVNAIYINDRGEIAGNGILPNGDFHDVLLVPASADEIAAAATAANHAAPRPDVVRRPRPTTSTGAWPAAPWLRGLTRSRRLP